MSIYPHNRTVVRLDGIDLNAISISTEGSRNFYIECDPIPSGARRASARNRCLEVELPSGRKLSYRGRLVNRCRQQITVAIDEINGGAQ